MEKEFLQHIDKEEKSSPEKQECGYHSLQLFLRSIHMFFTPLLLLITICWF